MRNHRYYFGKGLAILLWMAVVIVVYPAASHASPARDSAAAPRATEGIVPGVEEIPAWQARWELARVLSWLKRYDESITEYRKVIQEKPALSEAREEMARVLFWQGKAEAALVELERIPAGKINDGTRELMADLYRSNKQYEKGESLYRSILERSPDNNRVRLKLAEILSWAKRYDDSLAEYRTILAKLPQDIQVRRKYAFVLIWAGRHAEAAQELRKTLP
ncbi:MAG: tetratricopeptide repeat protein [Syntrophales bacterium]